MRWILCLLPLLPLLVSCSPPPTKGANLVVVTLDTVRADHLGLYGYEDARTPTLDRMGAEGVVFETAIATAPITLPTHSSIFTGLYPQNHGVRNNGSFVLAPEVETLAERLRSQGYDTAAVVSALVLDSKFGLDQGFRIYHDDLSAGDEAPMFMFKEVPANVSVDKAIELATEQLQEPFFLWLHLFDAHAQYDPPPPWDILYRKNPYDGEIAWLDTQIERFEEGLKTGGLADRTVTMITADHGDSLGEHGEQTHGIYIYRATTHIPWIIRGPGIAPARVSGVVSQVDMTPTLTELLGVPRLGTDGISLASTILNGSAVPKRPGVYAESLNPRMHFGWHELRSLDSGDKKIIEAPKRELYDLTTDPGEQTNLHDDAAPDPYFEALTALHQFDDLDSLNAKPPDHNTKDMLEALGYLTNLAQTSGPLPDPKDVAHRWIELQQCQARVRSEFFAEAVVCLEKLLAKDAGNWTATMSLASALRQLERYEESLRVTDAALLIDPESVKAHIAKSAVLNDLGKRPEAVAILKKATDIAPADPEPWNALGDTLQEDRVPGPALAAYGEALRRDDRYIESWVGVANVLHRTGDDTRALAYLERATAIDPRNLPAWYNRAVVTDALGRLDAAEECYRTALDIDPQHAMSWNNLGSLLRRLERDGEAEAAFRQSLLVDKDHIEALYNLASLTIETEPMKAIGMLEHVVAKRPDLELGWLALGRTLESVGRKQDALNAYAQQAKTATNPSMALLHSAALLQELNRTPEARDALNIALKKGDKNTKNRAGAFPALRPLLSP